MHIAHNTTACAQNKYTHRHIESLSHIKIQYQYFLSLNLFAYMLNLCDDVTVLILPFSGTEGFLWVGTWVWL